MAPRTLRFLGLTAVLACAAGGCASSADAPPMLGEGGDVFADETLVAFDTAPEPVETVQPEYPEIARDSDEEGTVVVEVLIDDHGRVEEARVAESDTIEALNQAAVVAARGWLFKPALRDGQPVRSKIAIPFKFEQP